MGSLGLAFCQSRRAFGSSLTWEASCQSVAVCGHPARRNHISEALHGQYNEPRKRKTFVFTDYVQVSQA